MGIIKNGSLFFTTELRPELISLFKETCCKEGAYFQETQAFVARQDPNITLVTAIANALQLSHDALATGISRTCLPGRFERIKENPLVILDGAHNALNMQRTVANLQTVSYRRLLLVIAIAANKDQFSILKEIIPYYRSLFGCTISLPPVTSSSTTICKTAATGIASNTPIIPPSSAPITVARITRSGERAIAREYTIG